jgi:hypothetical protein
MGRNALMGAKEEGAGRVDDGTGAEKGRWMGCTKHRNGRGWGGKGGEGGFEK